MTSAQPLDGWMNATVDAASEFSTTTLGAPLATLQTSALPVDLTGCFVALVGEEGSLQIGLASDAAGCMALAKALFGSDDDLPEEDVGDALGEIANIIMEGHIRLTERQQVAQLDISLGDVPTRLLLISNKGFG